MFAQRDRFGKLIQFAMAGEYTKAQLLTRANQANQMGWFENEAEYQQVLADIEEAFPE